ncbi:MAG: SDR family oxidoreductase [Candidatus Mcinerneyibacterium aminivorans]|jgi:UDP-glucose 4-epimerase|uniref:SDR family oxidoreductase n=1 Tax=Candidatus Mcinerneyibacterium aminivorans TaxID=2703815 RepID=A0A5D0MI85_9BACT|nr:MAG: SDR family oxidoreductase [Candidatus Mcinerneyibacterium aminivorans]
MFLITGGCGFIGSHIATELVKRNEDVKIIDNLTTGKMENIEHIIEDVKFIEGDIRNLELLEKELRDVDYIFHEAAMVSVVKSVENPLLCNEINTTGTLNLLQAAHKNGVKKVIMASSAAIYGDDPELPKREDMLRTPLSPYAASKISLEDYGKIYNEIYDLNTVSLRYFNVYGPRQDPSSSYSGVLSIFSNEFMNPDPELTIYGDGKQTRDFVFIKDVVEANMLALKRNEMNGKIYNVACNKQNSLLEIIQIMEEITDKKAQINYEMRRKGDIKYSYADISRIKKHGFAPQYSIKEGLKKYFNSLL